MTQFVSITTAVNFSHEHWVITLKGHDSKRKWPYNVLQYPNMADVRQKTPQTEQYIQFWNVVYAYIFSLATIGNKQDLNEYWYMTIKGHDSKGKCQNKGSSTTIDKTNIKRRFLRHLTMPKYGRCMLEDT